MAESDPFRASTDALCCYFVGDLTVAEALGRICAAAVEAVATATQAGISMRVDGRVGTYVHTHPEVREVDQPQYDTGEGPCVEAFRTGKVVVVDSTDGNGPFPAFRNVAAQHGFRTVLSLPLATTTQVVGALNLYAPVHHAFVASTGDELRPFTTHAAYLLMNHQAYWDARSLGEHLQQASVSRAEIEQAKGIIMNATGCDADEAFRQLRAQSQRENVKLRDIAVEIVRRSRRRP